LKRLKRHPESHSALFKVSVSTGVMLVLLVGLMFWLAFFTDACRIKRVVIAGNDHLEDGYIRRKSGVDSYRNLLTLPVGRIDRNLAEDPWIKGVKVTRKMLNTVVIEVVERKPVGVIDCGGTGFLADGDGHVIARVSPGEFKGLPRIHGSDTSLPRVDQTITGKEVLESVDVLDNMPEEISQTIQLVNPFDGRGQVLVSKAGFQIIYGSSSESEKKNEVLEAILADVKNSNRKIAYIDVRVPDSPVIKAN